VVLLVLLASLALLVEQEQLALKAQLDLVEQLVPLV
jgi:hypothetical protein